MPLVSTAYGRPLSPRFAALGSSEAFAALGSAQRRALAAEIATALGASFSASAELAGAAALPCVLHRPTGQRFIAICGGKMVMGLSAEEVDEIVRLYAPLSRAEEARQHALWATQPPRAVEIRPFLCASMPMTKRIAAPLLADLLHDGSAEEAPLEAPIGFRPRIAAELRGALGMRMLSEAEWEWIAREGGARHWLGQSPAAISLALDPARSTEKHENAFGIDLVHSGLEFVADAWHQSYAGAPSVGIAWEPRAIPDHTRGCPSHWEDEMEAMRLLAGMREGRHGDEDAVVRFAIDLP